MRVAALVVFTAVGFGALGADQAKAIGCVSGGVAGAVAGHVAGDHAVLGAAGGCIAGHEMNKHDKKEKQHAEQQQSAQKATAP